MLNPNLLCTGHFKDELGYCFQTDPYPLSPACKYTPGARPILALESSGEPDTEDAHPHKASAFLKEAERR